MTTFQTILCLVILAVLVGAFMFYQAYKEKNTKIEFTSENVKKTLGELGAQDIEETEDEGFLFRSHYGRLFWLDTRNNPVVKLVSYLNPEIPFEQERAQLAAEKTDRRWLGLYVSVNKDGQILFVCAAFMPSCNTLKEIMPYMASFIEDAMGAFIKDYKQIPIKAD